MDIEKFLSSELENDALPFEMDPGAEQRLLHAANIYASKHNIRKNSIIEPLITLFSMPLAGVKVAFIALLIMFSVGTGNFIFDSQTPLHCDSTAVHEELTDSLHHFQEVAIDSVVN